MSKSWGSSDSFGFFLLLSWTAVAVSRLVWERPAAVCCPATHSSRDPATGDFVSTSERKRERERERGREGGREGERESERVREGERECERV